MGTVFPLSFNLWLQTLFYILVFSMFIIYNAQFILNTTFLFQYDGQSKLPMKLPHDSQASNVPHIKEDIGTVTIRFNQKTTLKNLEQLLQQLLWDDTYKPLKILRLKANVNIVKDNDHVEGVLVQGASSQICISARHSRLR